MTRDEAERVTEELALWRGGMEEHQKADREAFHEIRKSLRDVARRQIAQSERLLIQAEDIAALKTIAKVSGIVGGLVASGVVAFVLKALG